MAVSAPILPTLYEFYAQPSIATGLSVEKPYFTLNDKNISIYSGAMHYFRVPKAKWRDGLRKMRAAGLNAVETYVPWNLHEPQSGVYDFGKGGSDMEEFLDVREFLKTAQEEDLLAIVRPGPYICSEWEFGGFPSWLLRERNIKLRTSDPIYMKYVTRYFNMLLPILAMLQFTKGGPIVAFQVENEYGSTERKNSFVPDREYLRQLRQLMLNNGIVELLFTSDSPASHGDVGTLPGVLFQTANFQSNPEAEFNRLGQLQPNKPFMAMEYWTGWFDHWSERHHTRGNLDFANVLERILKYPASVNMYMFYGGTSFGFLNGANQANSLSDNSGYQPDTTSYDYDAPLSETGGYTLKYVLVKELLTKYNPIKTKLPEAPTYKSPIAYNATPIEQELLLDGIIKNMNNFFLSSDYVVPMEYLPINNLSGQSYGYIIYRKENLNIPANALLQIFGHVCDTVIVMINGILMSKPLTHAKDLDGFGFWRAANSSMNLGPENLTNATLDLIVENWGRSGFGYLEQFNQHKGLWQGEVYLDGKELMNWKVIPLEFKRSWNNELTHWEVPLKRWNVGPSIYKATLAIEDDVIEDTFVNMEDWVKGIVIVNGFVLGRYSCIGPQQALYLPGSFLKKGNNTILVFEHYSPSDQITFSSSPIFKNADQLVTVVQN